MIYNKKKYYKELLKLNETQKRLYNKCVYGLNSYTESELNEMSPLQKSIIVRLHRRTQKVLNNLKQKRINNLSKPFARYFKNENAKKLFSSNLLSDKYKSDMSFAELYISKKEIIDELIAKDILPKNFYNLK